METIERFKNYTKAQIIMIMEWELRAYFLVNKETMRFLARQKKEWLLRLEEMLWKNLIRRQKNYAKGEKYD